MRLEYVTEEDVKSGAVKVAPLESRNAAIAIPDCEDMAALRPLVGADGTPGQRKYVSPRCFRYIRLRISCVVVHFDH
jgi:hypothetical protein